MTTNDSTYKPTKLKMSSLGINISDELNSNLSLRSTEYLIVGEHFVNNGHKTTNTFSLIVDYEGVAINSTINKRRTMNPEYPVQIYGKTYIDDALYVTGSINFIDNNNNIIRSITADGISDSDGSGSLNDRYWKESVATNIYYEGTVTFGNRLQSESNTYTVNIVESAGRDINKAQFALQSASSDDENVFRMAILGTTSNSPVVFNTLQNTPIEFHVGRNQDEYFKNVYRIKTIGLNGEDIFTDTNTPIYSDVDDSPHLTIDSNGNVGIRTGNNREMQYVTREINPTDNISIIYTEHNKPPTLQVDGTTYSKYILMYDYADKTIKNIDDIYLRRLGFSIDTKSIIPGEFAQGHFTFPSTLSINGPIDNTSLFKVHGDATITGALTVSGTITTSQLDIGSTVYFNNNIYVQDNVYFKSGLYTEVKDDVTGDLYWKKIQLDSRFFDNPVPVGVSNLYNNVQGIYTPGRIGAGITLSNELLTQVDEINHQSVVIKRDPTIFELELTDKSNPNYHKTAYIGHPNVSPNKNLERWITRISGAENEWSSVTWSPELSIYVAVSLKTDSAYSHVMTSPDSISWATQDSAADNDWTSVIWVPGIGENDELGLFVAVASSGVGDRVMTSPDGITWITQASAADNNWTSVVWAPELTRIVAVASSGDGDRVMTSSDGITWITQASAADNNWTSVTWAPPIRNTPGIFVAVASSGVGDRVMTSNDGIIWVTQASAEDNDWTSVAWAPEIGYFAAVSSTGTNDRVMISINGKIWSKQTSANDQDWTSIIWVSEQGLYIAVSRTLTNNQVMTSSNGITWTGYTSATNNEWTSVVYSPEQKRVVAVSSSGIWNRVMTSKYELNNSLTNDGSLVFVTPSPIDAKYNRAYPSGEQNFYFYPGEGTTNSMGISQFTLQSSRVPTLGIFYNKRVGINTFSPSHELDITGDIAVSGSYYIKKDGKSERMGVWMATTNSSTLNTPFGIYNGISYIDNTAPHVGINMNASEHFGLAVTGKILSVDGFYTDKGYRIVPLLNSYEMQGKPTPLYESTYLNGNIGIGVLSSDATLHIKDSRKITSLKLSQSPAVPSSTLIHFNGATTNYTWHLNDSSNSFELHYGEQSDMYNKTTLKPLIMTHSTNNVHQLVINSNLEFANRNINTAVLINGDVHIEGDLNITGQYKVNGTAVYISATDNSENNSSTPLTISPYDVSIIGNNIYVCSNKDTTTTTYATYIGWTGDTNNDPIPFDINTQSAALYVRNNKTESGICANYSTTSTACFSKFTTSDITNELVLGLSTEKRFFLGKNFETPYIVVDKDSLGIGTTKPDGSSLNVVSSNIVQPLANFTKRVTVPDAPNLVSDISMEKIVRNDSNFDSRFLWKMQGPNQEFNQKLQFLYGEGTRENPKFISLNTVLQEQYGWNDEIGQWLITTNSVSNDPDSQIIHAFDGLPTTVWRSLPFESVPLPYIEFNYPSPQQLVRFTLQGVEPSPELHNPTEWNIYASDDGTNFYLVQNYTATNIDTLEYEYNVINPVMSKWYRIEFVSSVDMSDLTTSYVQLGEIRFFTSIPPSEKVCITKDGCIGIGNTVPLYAIDILTSGDKGSIRMTQTDSDAAKPQLLFQSGSNLGFGLDEVTDYRFYAHKNTFSLDSTDNSGSINTLLNFGTNGNCGILGMSDDRYEVNIYGTLNVSSNILIAGRPFFSVPTPQNPTNIVLDWDNIYFNPYVPEYGGVTINGSAFTSNIFQVNSGNNGNVGVFNSTFDKSYIHFRNKTEGGVNSNNICRVGLSNNNFIQEFRSNIPEDELYITDSSSQYIRATELVYENNIFVQKLNGSIELTTDSPYITFNAINLIGSSNNSIYMMTSYFGIGTTSPTSKVDITNQEDMKCVVIRQKDTTHDCLNIVNSENTPYVAVASNGFVGIGTTVPVQPLHVETVATIGERLGIGILAPSTNLHVVGISTFDGNVRFTSDINVEGNGYVDGNFEIHGNLINDSDRSIKNNIQPIEDALEKIKQLSGYTFNKRDMERRETGVIAQEVQAVLPEAVFETNEGVLGVAYGNMVGLLIEAIKELSLKIDALKTS